MQTVSVKVQNDHLERVAKARKPILALAELVWNGLDADAKEIRIDLVENLLGGLEAITVTDNGHGIAYADAVPAFESLGGSWKRTQTQSRTLGRDLHGKGGRGRFQAFSLGSVVEWTTNYSESGQFLQYKIKGSLDDISKFVIEEPEVTTKHITGTTVYIRDILTELPSLLTESAVDGVAEQLALYLMKYADISVFYNDVLIDPQRAVVKMDEFVLSPITMDNGEKVNSELVIVEWKSSVARSLVLCDKSGFPLHEVTPGVQAPGFNFTAYLKSDYLRTLNDANALQMESLDPDVNQIVENAKDRLRQHFRVKTAEQAKNIVQEWVKEEIYPYSGIALDPVEQTERQVFDVLALSVNAYLPEFAKVDRKSKKLSFRLLKQAIEQNASAVLKILQEVLDLPKEKQNELANLLEKTSLTAIINASKEVSDRLDFLKALEFLVFDDQSKQKLLERKELHRFLAQETWVFGEEYRLTVDDQSLTEVLNKHLKLLGERSDVDDPVVVQDGGRGIVDLMLSRDLMLARMVPQPRAEEREHLIIELKRPRQKIDDDVVSQIRKYAFAVARDERFFHTHTRWNFVAISNEITSDVWMQAKQKDKPIGLVYDSSELNLSVWVKTWAQVIEEARARLHFYQERLHYQVDKDSAISYLKKTHSKYLPDFLKDAEG